MPFPCKNKLGIVEISEEFLTKIYVKIDALSDLLSNKLEAIYYKLSNTCSLENTLYNNRNCERINI